MSKEFQEEARKFGLTGYQYYRKLVEEGKMIDPKIVSHEQHENTVRNSQCSSSTEYRNNLAKNKGFRNHYDKQRNQQKEKGLNRCVDYENYLAQKQGWKDDAEKQREYCYSMGKRLPDNESCPVYLGVNIGERIVGRKILPIIVGDIIEEMPYANPGFEFVCKNNTNSNIRIDIKSSRLDNIEDYWEFSIVHNNIADRFLLVGFNKKYETKLKIIHIWLIEKNENVKIGKGFGKYEKFYNRKSIMICNNKYILSYFNKYDVTNILDDEIMKINKLLEEL